MAYNPYYSDQANPYNDVHTNSYGNGQRGYDRAYDNVSGSMQQPFEDTYRSQDEYAGYDQNPWTSQDEQYSYGYGSYEVNQWERQNKRPYGEHSRQKPMKVSHRNRNDHRHRHGHPYQGSGSRKEAYNQAYDHHVEWQSQDQTPQQWQDTQQPQHYDSRDGQYNFEAPKQGAAPTSKQKAPRNNYNSAQRPGGDHLPRYLNPDGRHDHGQSRGVENGETQPSTGDHVNTPQLKAPGHSKPTSNRGVSSCKYLALLLPHVAVFLMYCSTFETGQDFGRSQIARNNGMGQSIPNVSSQVQKKQTRRFKQCALFDSLKIPEHNPEAMAADRKLPIAEVVKALHKTTMPAAITLRLRIIRVLPQGAQWILLDHIIISLMAKMIELCILYQNHAPLTRRPTIDQSRMISHTAMGGSTN